MSYWVWFTTGLSLDCFFAALIAMTRERLLLRCARSNDSVVLDAKEKGEERVISFNLTVHSLLDLSAYDSYQQGLLVDDSLEVSPDEIQRRLPVANL